MLVLNILAMTDEEKREMRDGDPRAREILERTEAMTAEEIGCACTAPLRELRAGASAIDPRWTVWSDLERRGPESIDVGGVEVRARQRACAWRRVGQARHLRRRRSTGAPRS